MIIKAIYENGKIELLEETQVKGRYEVEIKFLQELKRKGVMSLEEWLKLPAGSLVHLAQGGMGSGDFDEADID